MGLPDAKNLPHVFAEYDTDTQEVCLQYDEGIWTTTRNPAWTLERIRGAFPLTSSTKLFEELVEYIDEYYCHLEDGEEYENMGAQLIGLTLLHRYYGTAFFVE